MIIAHTYVTIDHLDVRPRDTLLTTLTAPSDYTPVSYTVSFGAGQQNTTLMVPTLHDNTTELSEYFEVLITSADPDAVDIGSPNTSCITIKDNDPGTYVLHTYHQYNYCHFDSAAMLAQKVCIHVCEYHMVWVWNDMDGVSGVTCASFSTVVNTIC